MKGHQEQLPPLVRKRRDEVGIGVSAVDNVSCAFLSFVVFFSSSPFSTHEPRDILVQHVMYAHDVLESYFVDNSFNMETFIKSFRVESFQQETDGNESSCTFAVVGLDAPIANALRRCMLARVPTMAVDVIRVLCNTSVVPDEILVHRVGLVPLKAPAKHFAYPPQHVTQGTTPDNESIGAQLSEGNSLVFSLDVTCSIQGGKKVNQVVKSGALRWVPKGGQGQLFTEDQVGPVHDDIVLALLEPGECIKLECFAVKGRGETHAKWSPVSTASYRLRPIVRLFPSAPIRGADASLLKDVCPGKVFDIEDGVAVVSNPGNCTMCRECIRREEWKGRVELAKDKTYYIFSIESTGAYSAKDIFREGIRELMATLAAAEASIKQLKEAGSNE